MRTSLAFVLLCACGGTPAPAQKPTEPAPAATQNDVGQITADHARKLAAAAVEWRRAHGGCPTTKNLTDEYAFAPGTDADGEGASMAIECADTEVRVVTASHAVALATPYAPKPHVEPATDPSGTTTPPSVPVSSADKVVAALRPPFKACFSKALSRNPDVSGEVHGTLVVAADGTVKQVILDPKRTTVQDGELKACIVRELDHKHFFDDTGGKETRVDF